MSFKKIIFKDKRKNPKILFNNIKNAITLYKKNKEKKRKQL